MESLIIDVLNTILFLGRAVDNWGCNAATTVGRGSESVSLAPAIVTGRLHAVVSHVLATVVRGGTGTSSLVAMTAIHWLGSHVPEVAATAAIVEVTLVVCCITMAFGVVLAAILSLVAHGLTFVMIVGPLLMVHWHVFM